MNRLAITADDFGLSEEVNTAVEEAHRRGILSAASLMVGAPAAAGAVARARRLPGLRVGLHLVLVDGDPVTDRAQIPRMIGAGGRLRNDLLGYAGEIALLPSLRRQVAQEIAAQFDAYRATGLPLDHVNTHRHFHMHPAVASLILEIGQRYGLDALRIPDEPWRIVAAIDPQTRGRGHAIIAPFNTWLRAQARRAGLTTADAVFGLAWSGAMTAKRVAALLGRLPPGFVEIYLHPAVVDNFAGAAQGYRYAEEFAALCDAECIAALRRSGFSLGGYADARATR